MPRKMQLSLCYAVVLLTAFGQAPDAGKQNKGILQKVEPIRLARTEAGYEATLLFQSNSGLLSFGIQPQRGSTGATLAMTKRIELWRPLMNRLLREQGRRKEYIVAVGEYPELGARIASAAVCSGQWNLETGKPLTGSASQEVKNILTKQPASELEPFFSSFGFRVSVDNVENVVICPWARVRPVQDLPCGSAPAPTAQVPCAASILFRITAAG